MPSFKKNCMAALSVASLLLGASPARAQVYATQSGRRMEVNMATGPWNTNTIVREPGGPSGNLYVTGQVTGGFSFRGNSPYYGASQLRLSLPSETIDNFTRDSVGVGSVTSGMTYRPQAYFSASSTAYMLNSRAARQDTSSNLAGEGYQPTVSTATVTTQRYYDSNVETYASSLSPRAMTAMMARVRTSGTGTFVGADLPAGVGVADAASGAARQPFSGLFGYMDVDQQQRLGESLFDEDRGGPDEQLDAAAVPSTRIGGQQDDRDETAGPNVHRRMIDEQADQQRYLESEQREESPESPATQEVPNGDELQELGGGDVFVGVLMSVRRGEAATRDLESLDTAPNDENFSPSMVRRSDVAVVDRFGGDRDDRFNRLMAAGDRLMRSGDYYQAAMRYQVASRVSEYNPLAPLGTALAYFAAGESYRAGYYLEAALGTYPELLKVRIDLPAMMGETLSSDRLEELTDRLEGVDPQLPQAPLMLMLAFVEYNMGDRDRAGHWAEALEKIPGISPATRIFVRTVLDEKAPAGDDAARAETPDTSEAGPQ